MVSKYETKYISFLFSVLEIGANLHRVNRVLIVGLYSRLHEILQCFGRAGRRGEDGKWRRAMCILLYNNTDLARNVISDAVRQYCSSETCLKVKLSAFFGSSYGRVASEWCCSVCLGLNRNSDNGDDEVEEEEDDE